MARIMAVSQPEKIVKALTDAGVLHGQQVVADIPDVRIGGATLFFCDVPRVDVTARRGMSDGHPLPAWIPVPAGMPDDLNNGYYTIKGATITPNGSIGIDVTQATFVKTS